jgi:CDP-glucose 4,6-dehydratase
VGFWYGSLEGLVIAVFWNRRKVLITGHTGFKGSWLSLWLERLGAEICGVALNPPTTPNLFEEARVGRSIRSEIADIRDLDRMKSLLGEHQPEIVFHMAAQPLVRQSYSDPIGTYTTNVMGTANVLEAVRGCGSVRAVVVITTDKCYENKEWVWAYRECDRLGGYDPYSNSKACAELVVAAYRDSFFPVAHYDQHGVAIATARAGNVIGGGDWAKDRLIPDIMRAFAAGEVLKIRNPNAVRPWQHVLEPLSGYLKLAERLHDSNGAFAEGWNFGPAYNDARPVGWIVSRLAAAWGEDVKWEIDPGPHPHEAQMLKLDWSKAAQKLRWSPVLSLSEALRFTVEWYQRWGAGDDMREFTFRQIEQFETLSQGIDEASLQITAH